MKKEMFQNTTFGHCHEPANQTYKIEEMPKLDYNKIKTLAEIEKDHIVFALKKCNGNKMKTARTLDISTKTLYNKMHEYNLM